MPVAGTRKSPDAVSAVSLPLPTIEPPDVLHVTATPVLSPADVRPYAANWICWAGATVRLSGRMTIWTTGAGPVGAANRSQATPPAAETTHRLPRPAEAFERHCE